MPPARKKGASPIKRHHAFHGVIMILGWLLPPLAVLVRFGIGVDFFVNIFLTICGYIPGHGHNFWIQNIRNNKNSKHSPSWAIRYGLVKDYRVKKTSNGWSDRYGQGASDFQNAEVIVDPITGETRRDTDLDTHAKRGNIGGGHRFPAPWANNVEDSPRAEREDPYDDAHRSGGSGSGSAHRGGRQVRDPVTGAIIDDGSGGGRDGGYGGGSLSRSSSRRSLGSRYAERYGLGAGDNSSRDSSSFNQEAQEGGRRWGGLGGSSKKKAAAASGKKDRWAREADVMGDPQRGGYRNDSFGSYDDDRSSDAAASRSGGGGRNGRTIRDPMEDRHDF